MRIRVFPCGCGEPTDDGVIPIRCPRCDGPRRTVEPISTRATGALKPNSGKPASLISAA